MGFYDMENPEINQIIERILDYINKKYGFMCLILVFLTTQMIGQSHRNVIGKYISPKSQVSKKENQKSKLSELARAITKNSQSDSEKVYAIYHWIASNIKYDTDLRFNKKLQREIYISEENVVANVLDRKMALCGGYAFLFRDLCEKVNIPVEVIHGYTKLAGGRSQNFKQPNHTWNAVKLDGNWQLIDITWAVGFGNNGKPDDFWFATNPKDFIYTHYPEAHKWTLLGSSVSFTEFKRR